MPKESLEDYVARKKAKGVWGQPKSRTLEGRTVYTGQCPCRICGHEGEPMLLCDPKYENCHCCADWCS